MSPSGPYDPEFHDALGELHSPVLGVAEVESFLTDVANLAAAAVETRAEVACGITTRYDRNPVTSAASDPRAAKVDEAQYASGAGPCLEAMSTGQVVEVTDQQSDPRWEAYRRTALDLGVTCSLSMPLFVDQSSVGALNLYGFGPADWLSGSGRQRAEVFAGQASTALTPALRFSDRAERSGQLVEALHARSIVDRALGILMVEQKCDSRTAFNLLRQRSQSAHRKLRDVATDPVGTRERPPARGRDPVPGNRSTPVVPDC
ncbi:GAF and ANTAR domain-containing protein [Nocardioides sp. B-3]|uniref:GAF and ANTAR domain-containing protein n=1 Tax=Nocardioides sp. B-3 TaxID=2895565 RepID=UPI00215336EE|nr:GAF and ANTAR domain-containing protein [Nocardioides sp. B-3]UUZ59246.1 GAF and ANTAR domain-containing protein [Nocardioides sp. B-3]